MKKKSRELLEFGKIIRFYRHKLNLTQEQLAEKIGCHLNHLSRIERAEVDLSFSMIVKIARALNLSICEIMPK